MSLRQSKKAIRVRGIQTVGRKGYTVDEKTSTHRIQHTVLNTKWERKAIRTTHTLTQKAKQSKKRDKTKSRGQLFLLLVVNYDNSSVKVPI